MTKTESYYTSTSGEKVGKSNYAQTAYTPAGDYVASVTDDRGNTVSTNTYDTSSDGYIKRGNLIRNTDGNGNVTRYFYDSRNDRITSVKAVDKNNTSAAIAQNSYQYENERLKEINAGLGTDTVDYSFAYDSYGNQKTVHVGNQNLITNTYAANNGNLTGSTYGNGDTVSYTYDTYDRVTGVRYEGDTSDRYTYSYDAEGRLSRVVDNENNKTYTYVYDVIGRPVSVNCSDGTKISFAFDNFNKSTKTSCQIDGLTRSVSYTYNESKDNALDTTTFANGSAFQNVYNDYGQLVRTVLTRNDNTWRNRRSYFVPTDATRYSNVIADVNFPEWGTAGKRIFYTYDLNGNITKISEGVDTSTAATATTKVTYTYDQLNQLVSEVNNYTGQTVEYTYDARGNILSKEITENGVTDTINYTYGDTNWKDKLTAYDGKAITYDEIGNPLTYDGWTFNWQKGRQLAGMSNTDTTLAFTYNSDGTRASKTVNGTTTEYYIDGSTILAQETGDQTLRFHYDGNGTRVYMEVRSTSTGATQGYYYIYNNQGDVIALLDSTFAVICEYTYDSWGRVVNISGNTTIGNLNPFRYRGYYYDSETGLYYLQSRYYNPEIGRFINADGLIQSDNGVLDKNMFIYCGNNPIINHDPEGACWHYLWIFGDCVKCKAAKTKTVDAITQADATIAAGGSIVYELSKGWSARIDAENAGAGTKRHIHVEKNGQQYAQNKDGSPHDNSTGSPPKSVVKELKNIARWDWDKKAKSWENSKKVMLHHCYPEAQAEGNCTCRPQFPSYGPNIGPIVEGYPSVPVPSPAPSPFLPWVLPIPVS